MTGTQWETGGFRRLPQLHSSATENDLNGNTCGQQRARRSRIRDKRLSKKKLKRNEDEETRRIEENDRTLV